MRTLSRAVVARVPATTSNLGPGFDILGMALDLFNEVRVETTAQAGPDVVLVSGEGAGTLPRGAGNLVAATIRTRLPRRLFPRALRVECVNRIPLARGLGSSAAARLGGLLAAELLRHGEIQDGPGLLEAASRLEGHPDNVAAAYYGGLVAAAEAHGRLEVARLRVPAALRAVVCIPAFELPTAEARRALPKRVPLRDAVFTAGRLVFLLDALERGNLPRLRWAMEDALHQPYRSRLVPGLEGVIAAAVRAGAFGATLSGAGPSVVALAQSGRTAQRVAGAMERAFAARAVKSRSRILGISTRGARTSCSDRPRRAP